MPIERWECEHCGDIYDSEWECEDHEKECPENLDVRIQGLLESKCMTCQRYDIMLNYFPIECKTQHASLPVEHCDMYEVSEELPQLLRMHNVWMKVSDFKRMLAQ